MAQARHAAGQQHSVTDEIMFTACMAWYGGPHDIINACYVKHALLWTWLLQVVSTGWPVFSLCWSNTQRLLVAGGNSVLHIYKVCCYGRQLQHQLSAVDGDVTAVWDAAIASRSCHTLQLLLVIMVVLL
jgi:hypothetical protein